MRPNRIFVSLLLICLTTNTTHADWLALGGNGLRQCDAPDAPRSLQHLAWQAPFGLNDAPLVFEGAASPVVYSGRVFANARHFDPPGTYTANKLVALDATTGAVLFETIVDMGLLDSWSSPTVDAENDAVLFGSGDTVYSIDAATGDVTWQTALSRPIVNASIAIADGHPHGRALITDFDGFGNAASLYCINTGAFSPDNPFERGEIVWQESIGGASGATPTCAGGAVYVACVSTPDAGPGIYAGHISAYAIDGPPESRQLWRTALADLGITHQGFFGGVSINNGHLYAATYNVHGSGDNATLIKIEANSGDVVWTIPCERTNAIPVFIDGRVYVSAGLLGFGSAPKVQAFADLGVSAAKLWDTYVDSGGQVRIGGWTHQPVHSNGRLMVGAIPTTFPFFGPNTDLYIIDLASTPDQPGFVVDHVAGFGSSPAVSSGRLFSTGGNGMYAVTVRGDFCGAESMPDGALTVGDLDCFAEALLAGDAAPGSVSIGDFNDDGYFDGRDVPGLVAALAGP